MTFVISCNRLFYENKLLDGVTADDRTPVVVSEIFNISYSFFEKGCPTKPHTTMPKGIMGHGVHGP